MDRIQQMEEQKQAEIERKRRENAIMSMRRSMMKSEEEQRAMQLQRELLEKQAMQEQKWKERQEMIAQKRQEEAVEREQQRKLKAEEFARKMKENEERKYLLLMEKKAILENKYQNFLKYINDKKAEKAQKAIQSKLEFEKKKQSIIVNKEKEQEQIAYVR